MPKRESRPLRPLKRRREHYGAALSSVDLSKPPDAQYPGQRHANDPWLAALRDAGQEFWRKRGVNVPSNVTVDVADDLETDDREPGGVLGRGWMPRDDPSGRVALKGYDVGVGLRRARSKHRSVADRRIALEYLGSLMFHEMGHVGGLEHTSDGLMSPGVDAVPWEAKQLIRRLIPKSDAGKSRKRHHRGV